VVQLVLDGFDVRVFSTNLKKARAYFGEDVEYADGNVSNRESLKAAMRGCDYVYVNLKGGPTAKDYIRIEEDGSRNIYGAAVETGIKKLVQISEARADEAHEFFIAEKVKVAAEKALKTSGLTYVILKPTWFCESLPLMVRGNKATLVGSGKATFHFLAAADYAAIVSECFTTDKADHKSLVVFGPEPILLSDALRRFLLIAYPDVKVSRIPIWLAKWAAVLSTNRNMKALVNLMVFFNKHDDSRIAGDPADADALFGRSNTTLEEYARMYRKIVKGV